MARALQLAARGTYTTSPNPRVGCILVDVNQQIIAEGWHKKAGFGHGEVNALADCLNRKHSPKGATAYVTLEPCSHQGRTGACADALIQAGIARVVYAMVDPNPLVAGNGLKKLQAAGIITDGPLLEDEAKALNPGFIKRMQTGLPRIFAKTASSLDGRTAMQSGESQWITGPAARADVQKLRARSCAIITGVGTVLHDDPSMTVREQSLLIADGENTQLRQPLRVIVDSQLQTPLSAKILQEPGQALLVYAHSDTAKINAFADAGLETLHLPNDDGKVDLNALIQELGRRQINEVMVEAGAHLLGAFIQAELLDELYLYMATTLLGTDARGLATLQWTKMHQQLRFDLSDIRKVGDDIRLQLTPKYDRSEN
ncbi:MAG: bifunctional diaminohydroxyphosphoribosylaminopyrimidine deaminase/5-amino-6-(5-phosphoribosylamino)uracil reductase RibD [Pseudomonadales bacterium]|nr:bifunctional diaminohydroxyphosphoribosylaminopyrimidine deaminase/5-amino-6-(5-phosphoribosylamino)uracil reductase RibD [Pseudomonadales bacterium]